MRARTVVVLPTYNEALTIRSTLDAVLDSPLRPNVLVVDDNSPDGTAALVERSAACHRSRVSLLRRPGKQGLGSAYRAGFAEALRLGADRIVQMDADGSHPVEALVRMANSADRGASLVIGSRYCPGGGVDDAWAWHRKALSRGGNRFARSVLGLPEVRDLTGGFKMWDAALLRRLELATANAAGYGFQIQTTLAAIAAGAVIAEIPIRFAERTAGSSKMSNAIILEAMLAVLRMRRGARQSAPTLLARTEPAPAAEVVRSA